MRDKGLVTNSEQIKTPDVIFCIKQ